MDTAVAHALTVLRNGKVLVTGGTSAGRYPNETIEASAEIYDPSTGRFTPAGNMNIPRYKHAAELLADGRVLITGGSDQRAWRGKYASAEIYDPAKGVFAPARSMNFERFKLTKAVVLLNNGKMLMAGGAERPEVYDPATGTFQIAAGTVGEGRFFSTATLLSNGKVLIAGGYGEHVEPSSANAWLYQP